MKNIFPQGLSIKCCFGCPDRVVGCHSICERYKEAKERVDLESAKMDKANDADKRLNRYVVESCIATKKRKGR